MIRLERKKNIYTLIIEVFLTIGIGIGMILVSMSNLGVITKNFATEVGEDYNTLSNNYLRAFKIIKMEALEKIAEDYSFDEMQAWLQSKNHLYRDAIGDDIYDGFAFTYKGGYAHSWSYGDYTQYDASDRPWYKTAKESNGKVVFVAPYVTFLSGTEFVASYDSLCMSVVQRFNDEISFDLDLKVTEINALLTNRSTLYEGTKAFMYNREGYILSSTDVKYYGHNINTPDPIINQELSDILTSITSHAFKFINTKQGLKTVFKYSHNDGKTVCIFVPFEQVFVRNFLYVFLLALVLITMEVGFYHRNNRHILMLEESRTNIKDALNQAENASKAKGNFLSRMSHEIRTPLNAIIGYMEIAQDEQDDQKKVSHCIEKAQFASKHLLSIINDVLDISAIESGRMKIANDDFDIKEMINSLSTLFYSQALEKGISFSVKTEPLEYEFLRGDVMRVRQVLLNILSNAIKFTPANGHIQVGIRQVGVGREKVRLEFTVKDDGIGMSPEFKNRMFKPFEQEHSSTARKYGGTGLGLSISNNLVHMMGGKISVESAPGKGTTFSVLIAFDKPHSTQTQTFEKKEFNSIRALVVDDDEDTCAYMEKLFKRIEVSCDTVTSGKKALRRISTRKESGHPYDLFIVDWYMKEMDGLATAKEIRKICGEDVPIIVTSAYDFSSVEKEASVIGVTKIVSKPLFQSTLIDLLVNTYGKYTPKNEKISVKRDFTGLKLILAEDNEMNMEIATEILRKTGLQITPAVNGQEALDLFEQSSPNTFDAILMDIQMPILDGYAATRKIRESSHPQARTIPIIAITANAFSEDVTAALASGMNDHVSKPISYDRLYAVLDRLIAKEK